MTAAKGELSGADAALRDLAITAAQERAAHITLAALAITLHGDNAAAALRPVLEAIGAVPYEPGRPVKPPDGCQKTITSYRRPGA